MLKIIICAVVVTIVGLFIMNRISVSKTEPTISYVEESISTDVNGNVKVTISGEVIHPGTYSLSSQATLADLIALAGGISEDADVNSYTPGLIINGHTSFYISKINGEAKACTVEKIEKININTATESELLTILSSSQAKALVAYRQENGRFTSIEDIMKVSGIGEKTFANVKDSISLQ